MVYVLSDRRDICCTAGLELSLENLEVKEECLKDLGLPYQVSAGMIISAHIRFEYFST